MKVRLLIWVSLLAFLVSCEQRADIVIPTPAEKTVLVYFAADNNLAQYVQLDIDEMKQSMEEHPLSVSQHLLLYKDTGGEAELIELVNRNGQVIEKVVKTYPDRNSVGVEDMSEVFNDVFNNSNYEAESYGLVYWSHCEGWIPYPLPSTRWIGQDKGQGDNRMNLSEFKQVLNTAPHFDYILFDACFMQSIEVMYELRAYADYFIASPTETPGTGAPYDAILPYLFGNGRAADLAKVYYEVYADLYNLENRPQYITDPWTMGAAICVAESVGLEALAGATREALQALEAPANCTFLRNQAFDYDKRSGGVHIGYYDLADIMRALLNDDAYVAWEQVYEEAVIYYNTTETNFCGDLQDDFLMTGTHGVTQYLPSAPGVEACEAYHTLDWYDAAGISALGW